MSVAKPCLGYPSRSAAAVALAGQGLSTRQIAERIGIDPCTASALLCSARRKAERADAFHQFDEGTLKVLRAHAARRHLGVNALVRLLIETAVDENLIDAILDDAEGS